MKGIRDTFKVARGSPSCAILCNRWVSDVLWTNAINVTAQADIATTNLFNRTMSLYFMDLETFDMNSSGVFRVFYGHIHLYCITYPHVPIQQPVMTPEWLRDTMEFCSSVSLSLAGNTIPTYPRNERTTEEKETLPRNDSNKNYWKPDPSAIISTKRSSRKPITRYDTVHSSDPRKSLSAIKGLINHDQSITKTVYEKSKENINYYIVIIQNYSTKRTFNCEFRIFLDKYECIIIKNIQCISI
jgi:hypothetical protein